MDRKKPPSSVIRPPSPAPLRIGHRGACGYVPENTLLSLRKALEFGVDGIEFDVHASKDGVPMVMHDATLKRTTGARGRVSDFTAKELKRFDAGMGEEIPTLEEYIRAAGDIKLFIEIKDPVSVPGVAKLVDKYARHSAQGYAQYPIISFLWKSLLAVREHNSQILLGASPRQRPTAGFIKRAGAVGMWSVNPCIKHVTAGLVKQAHAQGLRVITWTANTPAEIAKAKRLRVDGIISDYPDRL